MKGVEVRFHIRHNFQSQAVLHRNRMDVADKVYSNSLKDKRKLAFVIKRKKSSQFVILSPSRKIIGMVKSFNKIKHKKADYQVDF
jgi:hypothetical protein